MNKLYFGDNLDILREHIATESVDLIYLDKRNDSSRGATPYPHPRVKQASATMRRISGRNPGLAEPNMFSKPAKGEVSYIKIIVSVKGGENVNVAMIRDLAHAIDRERAAMGFFVTFADPTGPMTKEAIAFGYYDQDRFGSEYPKLQILTIEGLMDGRERPRFPDLSMGRATFKNAAVEDVSGEQGKIF